MTTRIYTPRLASEQAPAERRGGMDGMDGWRIEVDAALEGRAAHETVHPNGDRIAMRVCVCTLSAELWRAGHDAASLVWACIDPLFETIYVSRAVTDEEAVTLRRLLHEEEMRRHEATRYDPRTDPHVIESYSADDLAEGLITREEWDADHPGPNVTPCSWRAQRIGTVKEVLERDGEGNASLVTMQLGAAYATMTEAERSTIMERALREGARPLREERKHRGVTYDGSSPLSMPGIPVSAIDPTRLAEHYRPPQERLPQVGDEVEVLWPLAETDIRAWVKAIVYRRDGWFFARVQGQGSGAWPDDAQGTGWRWPARDEGDGA